MARETWALEFQGLWRVRRLEAERSRGRQRRQPIVEFAGVVAKASSSAQAKHDRATESAGETTTHELASLLRGHDRWGSPLS